MCLSAIWAPILPACLRWPLIDPHALLAPIKPGKLHQIVAKETAVPRTSIQARSTGGWYFSDDAVRFLRRGNRGRAELVKSWVSRTQFGSLAPESDNCSRIR